MYGHARVCGKKEHYTHKLQQYFGGCLPGGRSAWGAGRLTGGHAHAATAVCAAAWQFGWVALPLPLPHCCYPQLRLCLLVWGLLLRF